MNIMCDYSSSIWLVKYDWYILIQFAANDNILLVEVTSFVQFTYLVLVWKWLKFVVFAIFKLAHCMILMKFTIIDQLLTSAKCITHTDTSIARHFINRLSHLMICFKFLSCSGSWETKKNYKIPGLNAKTGWRPHLSGDESPSIHSMDL